MLSRKQITVPLCCLLIVGSMFLWTGCGPRVYDSTHASVSGFSGAEERTEGADFVKTEDEFMVVKRLLIGEDLYLLTRISDDAGAGKKVQALCRIPDYAAGMTGDTLPKPEILLPLDEGGQHRDLTAVGQSLYWVWEQNTHAITEGKPTVIADTLTVMRYDIEQGVAEKVYEFHDLEADTRFSYDGENIYYYVREDDGSVLRRVDTKNLEEEDVLRSQQIGYPDFISISDGIAGALETVDDGLLLVRYNLDTGKVLDKVKVPEALHGYDDLLTSEGYGVLSLRKSEGGTYGFFVFDYNRKTGYRLATADKTVDGALQLTDGVLTYHYLDYEAGEGTGIFDLRQGTQKSGVVAICPLT